MPTDKNVPPFDSFEHEHQVFERRVELGDPHLNGCLNPAKGTDRIAHEQYATHTWSPGGSGTCKSGMGPMQAGIGSETAARVQSKLA
jgi:hypothetical protein